MKYAEFMTAITDCYDNYKSPILEQITFKYIKERFKETDLEGIFSALIIKVNPKYKTPPSPADFEEIFPRFNVDIEAAEWFNKLSSTGNSLDNIMISDNRAEQALESFGGWIAFCQRSPEYEGLHRKRFIEAFIKAVKTESEPKLIYGESSRKFDKQPLIYGDKQKCLEVINKTELKMIDTDIFRRIE